MSKRKSMLLRLATREQKEHYKMYKSGSAWTFTCVCLMMGIFWQLTTVTTHAATMATSVQQPSQPATANGSVAVQSTSNASTATSSASNSIATAQNTSSASTATSSASNSIATAQNTNSASTATSSASNSIATAQNTSSASKLVASAANSTASVSHATSTAKNTALATTKPVIRTQVLAASTTSAVTPNQITTANLNGTNPVNLDADGNVSTEDKTAVANATVDQVDANFKAMQITKGKAATDVTNTIHDGGVTLVPTNISNTAGTMVFKNQIDTSNSFTFNATLTSQAASGGGGIGFILQPVDPQSAGVGVGSDPSADIGIYGQPNTTFIGRDGYVDSDKGKADTQWNQLVIRQTDATGKLTTTSPSWTTKPAAIADKSVPLTEYVTLTWTPTKVNSNSTVSGVLAYTAYRNVERTDQFQTIMTSVDTAATTTKSATVLLNRSVSIAAFGAVGNLSGGSNQRTVMVVDRDTSGKVITTSKSVGFIAKINTMPINIKYVSIDDNTTLHAPDETNVNVGDALTIAPTTDLSTNTFAPRVINGYRFVKAVASNGTNTLSVTNNVLNAATENDNVNNFVVYYTNKVTYTIQPVDAQGQAIAGLAPQQVQATIGAQVTAPTYAGYTPSNPEVTSPEADGTTVNVTYTANQGTLTVTYTGLPQAQTPAPLVVTGATGTTYQVATPVLAGYVADQAAVQGTYTQGDTPVTVHYTASMNSYQVVAVDTTGHAIAALAPTTETSVTDTKIVMPTYAGYTLVPDQTMPVTQAGVSVYHVQYTANAYHMTVTYAGLPARLTPAQKQVTGLTGTTYEVASPVIAGYTPNKTAVTGIYATADQNVTVTYTADTKRYKVQAIDATGKPIASLTMQEYDGQTGAAITYPDYPGYTVQKQGETIPADAHPTVAVEYIPNPATITVNYLGLPTVPAAQTATGVTDGVYQIVTPTVAGYTPDTALVTGIYSATGSQKVTVTYTPNDNSYTVTPVDATGTPIAGLAVTSMTTKTDSPITLPDYRSEGYTVATDQPQLSTIAGTTNYNVTYVTGEHMITVTYAGLAQAPAPETQAVKIGDTYSLVSPTITGYTPDQAIVTGTYQNGADTNFTVTYTPIMVTVTVSHTGLDSVTAATDTVQTVTGAYGTPFTIKPTTIAGYTPDQATLTGTFAADGSANVYVVKYTGKPASIQVTYQGAGSATPKATTLTGIVGASYTQVTPTLTGYTPDQTTVTGMFTAADSTTPQTVMVTYQANSKLLTYTLQPVDTTGKTLTNLAVVTGHADAGATIETPDYTSLGYIANDATITVPTMNNATIKVTYQKQVSYQLQAVDTQNVPISTLAPKNAVGIVGTTITPQSYPGYTLTDPQKTYQVPATDNSTIQVQYNVKNVTVLVVPVDGNGQKIADLTAQTVVQPGGTILDETHLTYAGYQVKKHAATTIPIGDEGITVNIPYAKVVTLSLSGTDQEEYTGKVQSIDPTKYTVTLPDGSNYPLQAGDIELAPNQASAQEVGTYDVQLTAAGQSALAAALQANYVVTFADHSAASFIITPIPEITANVTISTNKGDKVVSAVSGKVGAIVAVTVPDVAGYTPDRVTVPATVNADGTITTTDVVTYTANDVTADVTISEQGLITSDEQGQMVVPATGETDKTTTVTVPDITGYSHDKDKVTAMVNPDGTITTTDTVTYTPNAVKTTVTLLATGLATETEKQQLSVSVTGTTDQVVTVDIPKVAGYTTAQLTTKVTINPDGTVTPNETITYTPNGVTAKVTIPEHGLVTDDEKAKLVVPASGATDTSATITVPDITGYSHDKATVAATVNPDGTITTSDVVTYTANDVTADVTIPEQGLATGDEQGQLVVSATGKTDQNVTVKVPDITGYSHDKDTVVVTVNPDGTITTKDVVTYTPNGVIADVTIPEYGLVTSDEQKQMVVSATGETDKTTTVTVPDITGYSHDKDKVTATVNPDGTITTTDVVTYTPNAVKTTVTLLATGLATETEKQQLSVSVTGTTDQVVTVDIPKVAGYTTAQQKTKVTINPDGTVTPNETVTYTPNGVTAKVTIPEQGLVTDNEKAKLVVSASGATDTSATITVPDITGYSHDKDTVVATVNPDGTITTSDVVTYTANHVTADVTIPEQGLATGDEQGQLVVSATGKTDQNVTVTVPDITGYSHDKDTVVVTVNPDGTITTTDVVTYTPNGVIADVTIPEYGLVTSDEQKQMVVSATGETDKTTTVTVPDITGYSHDKDKVTATVNPDGTITTTDVVTYTPNAVKTTVTLLATGLATETEKQQLSVSVTGTTDQVVTVDIPKVAGYTTAQQKTKVTINPDGTVTPNETITYTPNGVTAKVTIPEQGLVTDNEKAKLVVSASGATDTSATITVPDITGYSHDKDKVTTTVNPDGTITTSDVVTYTANDVTADVTIPEQGLATGDEQGQLVVSATGKTDQNVTVTVPDITGYSHDKDTVVVTVNPDGTITTTDVVTYTPNGVIADVTIPEYGLVTSDEQKQMVVSATGETDKTTTVTVPDITGYSHDKDKVTATVNPDGTITTTDVVTYTPNAVKTTVTLLATGLATETEKQQLSVSVTGTTDQVVTVDIPKVAGYTTAQQKTKVTINPDGTVTPNETVTYTPNGVTAKVTIPEQGLVTDNEKAKLVVSASGATDTSATITVPDITGYSHDKDTVVATVNPDGTITTSDVVTYTANDVTADVTIPEQGLATGDEQGQLVVSATGKTDQNVTVKVPDITGYSHDKDTVVVTVNPDGTITTSDVVTYTPNQIVLPVRYLDLDQNNKLVISGTYTGTMDITTADFTPDVPTGYVLVAVDKPAKTLATNGVITVTLKHQHQAGTYTDSRTIHYVMATGDTLAKESILPKTVSQKVVYTTDTDAVTGITTYIPLDSTGFAAVMSPELPGYATSQNVAATSVQSTTDQPDVAGVTVIYHAVLMKYFVSPVDVSGQLLYGVTPTLQTGKTNMKVTVPEIPGYTAIDNDQVVPTDGANVTVTYIPNSVGHALPADQATVSNVNVWLKETVSSDVPHITTQQYDLTIVPVDLSGAPLYGQGVIVVKGVPGYLLSVPTIAGYTPVATTIMPVFGTNQVTYRPLKAYGQVPTDDATVSNTSVWEKDATPDPVSIDMNAGHKLPDDTATVSNTSVWEKVATPDPVSIDMNAGHKLPDDTATVSNTSVWEKVATPDPVFIDMNAGHKLPDDTAKVSNTSVWEKVATPDPVFIDMNAGHKLPDDTAKVSNTSVWEKVAMPDPVSIDMNAGHKLPDDTATVSNTSVWEKVATPDPVFIDMNAGHKLPDDTAKVSNTSVWEKVATPDPVSIDMNAGHKLPDDTATVSNTSVWEKVATPDPVFIDMNAGHKLPDDTVTVSNTSVWEKDAMPDPVSIDMNAGHKLPDDTATVSNTSVWEKAAMPDPVSIDMNAGHKLPDDTAKVSNTSVWEKVATPDPVFIDMNAGHKLPDDTAKVSNTSVWEKAATPDPVFIDMNAGHKLPDDTATVSNTSVWEKVATPDPVFIDMNAGHKLPDDTATVNNTSVWEKAATPDPVSIDMNAGHKLPDDTAKVSNTSVWEKVATPDPVSIDMNAGHKLPDDTATVSNTSVWEKAAMPDPVSIDMNAGHKLPEDTALVSNTHVWQKIAVSAPVVINVDVSCSLPNNIASRVPKNTAGSHASKTTDETDPAKQVVQVGDDISLAKHITSPSVYGTKRFNQRRTIKAIDTKLPQTSGDTKNASILSWIGMLGWAIAGIFSAIRLRQHK